MEQKGFLALVSIVIGFIANSISIPMIILLILMILDYVLGITASVKEERKFDKRIALWGIVKKIGYAVVILFAILVDLLISQGIVALQWDLPYKPIFAIVTTIYFCGLEFFSGCRHLITLGVPVPDFLMKFSNFLKEKSEDVMDVNEQGK
jgi:toxin secretion/phage lysis holin